VGNPWCSSFIYHFIIDHYLSLKPTNVGVGSGANDLAFDANALFARFPLES
jgi:hypothetical protein